jgi:hypothetical protein
LISSYLVIKTRRGWWHAVIRLLNRLLQISCPFKKKDKFLISFVCFVNNSITQYKYLIVFCSCYCSWKEKQSLSVKFYLFNHNKRTNNSCLNKTKKRANQIINIYLISLLKRRECLFSLHEYNGDKLWENWVAHSFKANISTMRWRFQTLLDVYCVYKYIQSEYTFLLFNDKIKRAKRFFLL